MNQVKAQAWFEQPCETLAECIEVRRLTRQPLLLDECLSNFDDHLSAWKQHACQGVKIKPNRLGGLTRARQARDFGIEVGWQMPLEDVGGTVIADTVAAHLALSTPETHRMTCWLCQEHVMDDPAPGQGARNMDGQTSLTDAPGIGVEPTEDWLGEPCAVYE